LIQKTGAPTVTLTKAKLSDSIHKQVDLPKTKSEQMIETLLDIIKETLENGEDVLISGFGKFYVKDKRERPRRNPRTGEEFTVKSRRVVTFKCSGVLREKVNGKERT